MRIAEVKVGELTDFVNSSAYNRLDIKPITPQRAVSQSKNPDASDSDLALVYAYENDTLLSFAGLMPARLNHKCGSASSNSGWWVSPDKGKTMGLPVFLRAFHGCDRKMFLTDCSAYTKEILEKTGYFDFFPPVNGKRWFLRFYTGQRWRKKGYGEPSVRVMSGIDTMMNLVKKPFDLCFENRTLSRSYEVFTTEKLEVGLVSFIEENSDRYFLRQDVNKLNWMVSNPWVYAEPGKSVADYPFTSLVESFHQHFLVIRKGGELRAVVLVSLRDKHASLPFYYGSEEWMSETALILRDHIISLQANSLIVYNQALIRAFDKIKLPAYYSTEITRYAGLSKTLTPFPAGRGLFQDGEADVVFT
jgi:hypothetical protein